MMFIFIWQQLLRYFAFTGNSASFIRFFMLQKSGGEQSGWSIFVDSHGGLSIEFTKNETDVIFAAEGLSEFAYLSFDEHKHTTLLGNFH